MPLSVKGPKEYSLLENVAQLALSADTYAQTDAHALRVGELSLAVALQLGLRREEALRIGQAALFHDVGKLGIPREVLEKPGRLTDDELNLVKGHTLLGAAILMMQTGSDNSLAIEIALNHHERWDGEGYPRRLKGLDIPLSGRIVGLADAFDALTSPRPYKIVWTVPVALEEIRRQAGTQFDPWVVEAFVQVVEREYPDPDTPWLVGRVLLEGRTHS